MEPLPEDGGEESVILISDDEAESTQGTSVIFVEPSGKCRASVLGKALQRHVVE